jgi:hypothetical protein
MLVKLYACGSHNTERWTFQRQALFWKKFSEVETDFTGNAGWLDHWT